MSAAGDGDPAALARAVRAGADRLAKSGLFADAATLSGKAVEILSELAEHDPAAYAAELAAAMNNHTGHLTAAGEFPRARDAGRAAVELNRRLAPESPAANGRYAVALMGLATILATLLQPWAALPYADKGVAIFTELAEQDPPQYEERRRDALDTRRMVREMSDMLRGGGEGGG